MLRKLRKLLFRAKTLQERYPEYKIGRTSYGTPKVLRWGEGATLEIGEYCSIAAGVKTFLGGNHRSDWVTTYPFTVFKPGIAGGITGHPATRGDVVIGSDVWIGTDAMLLSGIRIGHGAVIAAGALVTKDVPPYAVVGGNPSKLIKYRFSDEHIRQLLEIRWWDLDESIIDQLIPALPQQDIDLFITTATALKTAWEKS